VIDMPKMTKAQQKRMVKDILQKTKKLYLSPVGSSAPAVNSKDMDAIERLCAKWMKRIA